MAAVPKILKNFNLNVQGQGFAGLCDAVRLPDLRIKIDEHRAGGMDAPIPIDLGMEKIEIGFTMAEHNPMIFNQFGLQNGNAVTVNFYAALVDDSRVFHGVTAIRPTDPSRPAFRDVLVVTFRRE